MWNYLTFCLCKHFFKERKTPEQATKEKSSPESIYQCNHEHSNKDIKYSPAHCSDQKTSHVKSGDPSEQAENKTVLFDCPKHGQIVVTLSGQTEVAAEGFSFKSSFLANQPKTRKKTKTRISLITFQSQEEINFETRAIFLNLVICFVSISAWAPYITATCIKVLCHLNDCQFVISPLTMTKFKWATYLSTVFYLAGFILVDQELRDRIISYFVNHRRVCCRPMWLWQKCTDYIFNAIIHSK